jgi:hypothetical protein
MGNYSSASGISSTAMGDHTTAGGSASTAMGYYSIANGSYSTAMGYYSAASSLASMAMGYRDTANGSYSTAMGTYVSTNGKQGAFIIGDNSTSTMAYSSADNQMAMRFIGGYRLYTNANCTIGAVLATGGGSWSSISDARKKENYTKAKGEYFLTSLAQLKLGSWNYIGQDAEQFRHYGPMAQEVFRYFGKDSYGTIGNDTTLASADMDGIMMICLQALEKRTTELNTALNELKAEKEKVTHLQTSFDELKKEVVRMKSDIQSLSESNTEQTHSNMALGATNKGQ